MYELMCTKLAQLYMHSIVQVFRARSCDSSQFSEVFSGSLVALVLLLLPDSYACLLSAIVVMLVHTILVLSLLPDSSVCILTLSLP